MSGLKAAGILLRLLMDDKPHFPLELREKVGSTLETHEGIKEIHRQGISLPWDPTKGAWRFTTDASVWMIHIRWAIGKCYMYALQLYLSGHDVNLTSEEKASIEGLLFGMGLFSGRSVATIGKELKLAPLSQRYLYQYVEAEKRRRLDAA